MATFRDVMIANEGFAEYEIMGGAEGIDNYNRTEENYREDPVWDEDGEIRYEAMLSDKASWETELDARHGC